MTKYLVSKHEDVIKVLESHYKKAFSEIVQVEHWDKGVPIAQIARGLGLNPATVHTLMKKNGLRGRNHQESADFRNKQLWDKMKKKEKKKRVYYE